MGNVLSILPDLHNLELTKEDERLGLTKYQLTKKLKMLKSGDAYRRLDECISGGFLSMISDGKNPRYTINKRAIWNYCRESHEGRQFLIMTNNYFDIKAWLTGMKIGKE